MRLVETNGDGPTRGCGCISFADVSRASRLASQLKGGTQLAEERAYLHPVRALTGRHSHRGGGYYPPFTNLPNAAAINSLSGIRQQPASTAAGSAAGSALRKAGSTGGTAHRGVMCVLNTVQSVGLTTTRTGRPLRRCALTTYGWDIHRESVPRFERVAAQVCVDCDVRLCLVG